MTDQAVRQRKVQVWFGRHVIATYVAEPGPAGRYAEAMDRRYAGLRITNDPVLAPVLGAQPLPPARIWGTVTPH